LILIRKAALLSAVFIEGACIVKNPTCIAVDFDRSIAHFVHPATKSANDFDGFCKIFTSRGIPREMIAKIARGVSEGQGFTINRLVARVKSVLEFSYLPDEERIEEEFYAVTNECLAAYPETIDCMWEWRRRDIPVEIVTKGEPNYQQYKIELLKILCDSVYCVEPPARKSEALRDILKRYGAPVLFVDNCIGELDGVRDDGLSEAEVITVRIVRDDDVCGDGSSRHRHHEINSFRDIFERFFEK
jgi:FMN phosphatase YigB (HAD superfamily)